MMMTTMKCLNQLRNHLLLLNHKKRQLQLNRRSMTVMSQTTTLKSSSLKLLLSSNLLNRKNQLLSLQMTKMISNPLLCSRDPNNLHLVLKHHKLLPQLHQLQKVLHQASHQIQSPNKRVKKRSQVPRECQLLNWPQKLM